MGDSGKQKAPDRKIGGFLLHYAGGVSSHSRKVAPHSPSVRRCTAGRFMVW